MFDFFDSMEQNANFAKTISITTEDGDATVVTDYQIAYMLPSHGADRPRYAMAVKASERVPCLLYLIQLPFEEKQPVETPMEDA